MIVVAWSLAYIMRYTAGRIGWFDELTYSWRDMAFPTVISVVLSLLAFARVGLYEPKRTRSIISEGINIAKAISLVWLIVYVVVSFSNESKLSRAIMGLALVNWLILAMSIRMGTRKLLRWFRRNGWNLRSAAIVGSGRLAQELYYKINHNEWTGIQVRYFIENRRGSNSLLGLDVLGPLDEIASILADKPVDIVLVAMPGARHEDMKNTLNRLAMTNVDVRVVPDLLSFHFLRHEVSQLDEMPIIALTHSPQHGWRCVVKRAMDIIGALIAIVVLAIPMTVIALVIKMASKGPVFYCQQRTSLSGKPFTMFKFRTMIENAETETGPVWASSEDLRATRAGRFLRRTSLDELPQLLNVLVGQMSFVGPRPERPEFVERFRHHVPRYMLRDHVKAGLTGWAQVHGLRGRTSLRKRIQYDLYYISNWSLALDVWILVLSLFRGFLHPMPIDESSPID